jgi:hypothetical protein
VLGAYQLQSGFADNLALILQLPAAFEIVPVVFHFFDIDDGYCDAAFVRRPDLRSVNSRHEV